MNDTRNPATRVVRAMVRELHRQIGPDNLRSCTGVDRNGRLALSGVLDLAALALVTENSMRENFPKTEGKQG